MAHQVICRFDAPVNATEIHLPPGYKAVGITQHPGGITVWGEQMLYTEEQEQAQKDREGYVGYYKRQPEEGRDMQVGEQRHPYRIVPQVAPEQEESEHEDQEAA